VERERGSIMKMCYRPAKIRILCVWVMVRKPALKGGRVRYSLELNVNVRVSAPQLPGMLFFRGFN
jgi:hypothetical protein